MQKQFLLITLFGVTTFLLNAEKACCPKVEECIKTMNNCCKMMDECRTEDCTGCEKRLRAAAKKVEDCAEHLYEATQAKKKKGGKKGDRRVTDDDNTLNPGPGRAHYAEKDGAKTYNGRHKPKSERNSESHS